MRKRINVAYLPNSVIVTEFSEEVEAIISKIDNDEIDNYTAITRIAVLYDSYKKKIEDYIDCLSESWLKADVINYLSAIINTLIQERNETYYKLFNDDGEL